MTKEELLKKIRNIEIKAKGVSRQLFQGSYKSAFKGSGMTFAEVRQYNVGDETRTIDWNVTARYNEPFVKTYEEERELTVMLVVDVSASSLIATNAERKKDYIAEICAVIAYSAIKNNDKVGVMFFSDKVEKYIPPNKGKSHVLRIIHDLVNFEPKERGTDIVKALQYFNNAQRKRATVFLVSDFLVNQDYSRLLQITRLKHDLIALRVLADNEMNIPNVGWMFLKNIESGSFNMVNTSSSKVRKEYQKTYHVIKTNFQKLMLKSGVDYAELEVGVSYVKKLIGLFSKR